MKNKNNHTKFEIQNNTNENIKGNKGSKKFVNTFLFETIPDTFLSMWRNKRRSFALLTGIILAFTLLSGIMVYNNELRKNNYLSLIDDQPFEVQFYVQGDANDLVLNDMVAQVEDNTKVSSVGIYASSNNNAGSQIESLLNQTLTGNDYNYATPFFISDQFLESEMGEKLRDLDFQGDFNLTGDFIIISEQMAQRLNLKIGDLLPSINFTFSNYEGEMGSIEVGYLNNLTIKGTYRALLYEELDDSLINSGSQFSPFSGENVFLSIDLLFNSLTMDTIELEMRKSGNIFVAIKLEITEFSINNPTTFLKEVEFFINSITRNSEYLIQGNNLVEGPIEFFEAISIFITLLYLLISIPVIYLSFYLVKFGLGMSLEERKKDIAIKKVQGADGKQIFSELRNETLSLLFIGSIIGYILGLFSAWSISSATGFMKLSLNGSSLLEFLYFDIGAYLWPLALIGVLLIFRTYKRGRNFIESEVNEGVARKYMKKVSFFKRNKLDIIFFLIGLVGLIFVILELNHIEVPISEGIRGLISVLGPIFFWLGGSSVGSRLTKTIPLKLQGSLLKIKWFSDVKMVIKSGLKRRGDASKLSLIIILTLSIVTLSIIQGNTEENHARRNLDWQIGADWQVEFSQPGVYHEMINNVTGFQNTISYIETPIQIYSSYTTIMSIENSEELENINADVPVIHWLEDTFNYETAQSALKLLEDNPRGVFLLNDDFSRDSVVVGGSDDYESGGGNYVSNIGDSIEIKVPINNTNNITEIEDITILGSINHFPGGKEGYIFTSEILMREIVAINRGLNSNALDGMKLNSSKYFVRTEAGAQITDDEIKVMQNELDSFINIKSHYSFYYELSKLDTNASGFGISGLFSFNFIICMIASLVSAFSFSALLMEKRKHEFAILRAIGAKKEQIYRMALGENFLMMLTASIWGSFLGIGISYLFNGVFSFVSFMTGSMNTLSRLVVIPTAQLIIISTTLFIGMLGATILSIRSSANQNLALGIKDV